MFAPAAGQIQGNFPCTKPTTAKIFTPAAGQSASLHAIQVAMHWILSAAGAKFVGFVSPIQGEMHWIWPAAGAKILGFVDLVQGEMY